jgi:pimeloyl-ACP methyl ester carboxylesterase
MILLCLIATGAALSACGRSEGPEPTTPDPATTGSAAAAPTTQTRHLPPPQAEGREAFVASLAPDHTTIRYRVYGSGEPAMVFVHCWSCDSGYWDPQLNYFARTHTVITVDLAGHGASLGYRRKDWSMANFGADVAAAVNDAGVGRVVLVGSSMGGPVALEAARRLSGRVVGIVGVDTFREIAAPPPREQVDEIVAKLRADFAGTTAEFVGNNLFTDRTDPILKRWIVKDMSAAPPRFAIPAFVGLMDMDYRRALAELDVPIIALNAASTPTDEAGIRKVTPSFRVVELEGIGHFPMIEDADRFNHVLDRMVKAWSALEPTRNAATGTVPRGS